MRNGSKGSVVELWGREFNLAKNGFSQAQIVSFVNKLISERDLLAQKVEHITSLTKLAEKTVAEADRLAGEIDKEAEEQAKAKADVIVAEVEQQARQMIEEERGKIINMATEEAEAIKANAEREAGLLMERERQRIQTEIGDTAQQLCVELLSQVESLKQQVIAFEAEFEHKLSQPAEQASIVTIEKESPLAQVAVNTRRESDVTTDTGLEVSPEPVEGVSAESQQPIQTIDQTKASELRKRTLLSADSRDKSIYEGEVELEILPPIDISRIMGIMRHLDSLAEVTNTELIPLSDKPIITVFLGKPIYLIKELRTLLEVEEAEEITDEEITTVIDAAQTGGKRRKIQITLSETSG